MPESKATKAVAQVFGTTELLERILLHLPVKDVIILQRVTRSWMDTVASSLTLQKVACFKPTARPIGQANKSRPIPVCMDQSLWIKTSSQFRNKDALIVHHLKELLTSPRAQDFYNATNSATETLINPLFQGLLPTRGLAMHCFQYNRTTFAFMINDERQSWKKMYFTQPPITHVELMACPPPPRAPRHAFQNHPEWKIIITRLTGVTLGDLIERLDEKCEMEAKLYCNLSVEV